MQSLRINVPLDQTEMQALVSMAEVDCRHPREQMRWLLIQEARRRALLLAPTEDDQGDSTAPRENKESVIHATSR